MKRRDFLKGAAAAGATVIALPMVHSHTVEPDLALLERPRDMLDAQPVPPVSGNSLLTAEYITRELLRTIDKNLHFRSVSGDVSPVRFGDTVSIRGHRQTVLGHRRHVSYQFKTADLALSIDEYSNRYLEPCGMALAEDMNSAARAMSGPTQASPTRPAVITMGALGLPQSASFKARANFRGIHVRVLEDYDINVDQMILRADILYGLTRRLI